MVSCAIIRRPVENPEEKWKIDAPYVVVVANKKSARPKSSKIKGIKGEMTILMGGKWIFLFSVTTCACRCRSAGYLWLIIAVGPVALTIDLIKADKTWPFERTTHASQWNAAGNTWRVEVLAVRFVCCYVGIKIVFMWFGVWWPTSTLVLSDYHSFRLDKEQLEAQAAGCFFMSTLPCALARLGEEQCLSLDNRITNFGLFIRSSPLDFLDGPFLWWLQCTLSVLVDGKTCSMMCRRDGIIQLTFQLAHLAHLAPGIVYLWWSIMKSFLERCRRFL